jgi:type II secretory ATPase GspE/PulE/Tfp pilus assembly ATPase PilB-like protein
MGARQPMANSGPTPTLFQRLFNFGRPKELLPDPVTRLIDLILEEAITAGARRIHLCPQGSHVGLVRWYVKDEWHEVIKMPLANYSLVVGRLNAIGELDTARKTGQHATIPVAFGARVIDLPARSITNADNTQEVILDCPSL